MYTTAVERLPIPLYNLDMRFTQRKGDTAVSQAIATFTKIGYDISIPLTESAPYDLVIDVNGLLKRVQVRYSTSGDVDLRRIHSNSKGYVVKKAPKGAYDWLYIYKGSTGEEFLIIQCPFGRRSIKPGVEYLLVNVIKSIAV